MKNETLIWEKLEPFIRKETGIFAKTKLHRQTDLEDDLDITGDEAMDFMDEFFKYFHVDEGDFDTWRYSRK